MTEELAIEEVADIRRGTTPANTTESVGAVGFFGLAEISNGGIVTRSPEPESDMRRVVTLQEGDIVMALLGKVGQVTLVDRSAAGAVLGRECAAIRVRPNESRVTAGWLYLALQSEETRRFLESLATGSTMPRLSVKTLADVRVPAPSVPEQSAAVERLSRYDDAMRAHERVLAALQTLRATEINLALWSAENPGKTVGRKVRGKKAPIKARR